MFFNILKKRFYLFIHESQRERERDWEAEIQAEGEAGSMQEPNVGLDPGTPGSHPGPKEADTKLLSYPGIPKLAVIIIQHYYTSL